MYADYDDFFHHFFFFQLLTGVHVKISLDVAQQIKYEGLLEQISVNILKAVWMFSDSKTCNTSTRFEARLA